MEVSTTTELYLRRAILGALMIGVALASLISGRTPGPSLYALSMALAGVYVITALARWRGMGWIGVLAYALLMAAFLSAGKSGLPGMLAGLALAILTLLPRSKPLDEENTASGDDGAKPVQREADADLDRFHTQPDP